jgi:hypothetical protein
MAVNGLTRGTDYPRFLGGSIKGPLRNESYHPTPLGYGLLRDVVLVATNSLGAVMPAPNPAAAPPAETGLDILNMSHSGRTVSSTSYDNNLSGDILPRGSVSDIFVDGLENSLRPLASYRAELHSSPVVLGNFTAGSSGDLSFQITVPSSVPAGFHSLHIYGTNVAGEPVDIYKTIYVAASSDDYNGNGIPNASDPCVFVDSSGQDYDQDGIDDACDGQITDPPPPPAPVATIDTNTSPTQTLQPSVGLPAANQNPVILVDNSQTTMPEVAPASDSQDFFASYYSLPVPDKSSIASTPKVLGARTDSSPAHKYNPQKIIIGSIVAIFGVFSGTMLARKIGL